MIGGDAFFAISRTMDAGAAKLPHRCRSAAILAVPPPALGAEL
jgi:hypothetical protein